MGTKFCVAMLCLLGSARAVESPITYPEIDLARARPAVAVMRVSLGEYLPALEECKQKNVICLHSPFWFNAQVLQSVYGELPAERLKVSTLSHYGMEAYKAPLRPWLVSLVVDGANVVMPLYANDGLEQRRDGEWFLLQRWSDGPGWLPCSVKGLREEIAIRDFPNGMTMPTDEHEVLENPALYTVQGQHAFPRYGISVSRLREHLTRTAPAANEMGCKAEGE